MQPCIEAGNLTRHVYRATTSPRGQLLGNFKESEFRMSSLPYGDWRYFAERAAKETDSEELMKHVTRVLQIRDEDRPLQARPPTLSTPALPSHELITSAAHDRRTGIMDSLYQTAARLDRFGFAMLRLGLVEVSLLDWRP
jgi:hypothetical protein